MTSSFTFDIATLPVHVWVGGLNVLLGISCFSICLFGWFRFRTHALFCLCLGLFFGFIHECLGFFDIDHSDFYLRAFFTLSFLLVCFGWAFDAWPAGRYLSLMLGVTSVLWVLIFCAGLSHKIGLIHVGFPLSNYSFRAAPSLFALIFVISGVLKKGKHRVLMAACLGWWVLIPLLDTLEQRRFLCFPYYCLLMALIWQRASLGLLEMAEKIQVLLSEKEITLSFLQMLGEAAQDAFHLDRSLRLIMEFVQRTTRADGGVLYLISQDRSCLKPEVLVGLCPPLHDKVSRTLTKGRQVEERVAREHLSFTSGVVGEVASSGQAQFIGDASRDERIVVQDQDFLRVRSAMLVPLAVGSETLGVVVLVNLLREDSVSFGYYDMAILQALADQASVYINNARIHELTSLKERMERDLELAHEIQSMLIPATFPILPNVELAGINHPSQEVGGDYYDYVLIDNHHLGLVIGDVAGKGIAGALVMALTRAVLRAEGANCYSPRDVLCRANLVISDDIKQDMFVSLIYGILDLRSLQFRFARAGHHPLIVGRQGISEPELLAPGGISIGIDRGALFITCLEEETIQLEPGDMCLMFTDGVNEAENQDGEEFGMERLLRLFEQRGDGSAQDLVKTVDQAVKSFSGSGVPRDDVTLLAFKVGS